MTVKDLILALSKYHPDDGVEIYEEPNYQKFLTIHKRSGVQIGEIKIEDLDDVR